MLISDLFEQESRWQAFKRGFSQELARRYVPDIEFAKVKPAAKSQPAPATKIQPQPVQPTTRAPASVTPTQTQPQPTAAATQSPATPVAPQPAAKPRVLAQPIRVGNKIYRPGDPMHARLSQMMQSQGRK